MSLFFMNIGLIHLVKALRLLRGNPGLAKRFSEKIMNKLIQGHLQDNPAQILRTGIRKGRRNRLTQEALEDTAAELNFPERGLDLNDLEFGSISEKMMEQFLQEIGTAIQGRAVGSITRRR